MEEEHLNETTCWLAEQEARLHHFGHVPDQEGTCWDKLRQLSEDVVAECPRPAISNQEPALVPLG